MSASAVLAPIHLSVPLASASACLTDSVAVASFAAMAVVPIMIASTGIAGRPYFSAQEPVRYSAARSGVPTPPPTASTALARARISS